MDPRRFFEELKRRNVYRVAVAYAVVSWLLIQVATQVSPYFEIPNWAVRLLILLLIIGLPVALILSWAFEITPEGIKRTEDVPGDQSIARRTGRKLLALVSVVAAISMALLLYRQAGPSASEAKLNVAAPGLPEKSIAVLPFANLSANQENEFFTVGMQDEILTDLGKVADLKVISRNSAAIYKPGAPRNIREIAEQLGVTHVLEGSVQRSANRVRATAQLIDARTDVHIWAEHYDRDLTDAFAIQTEIAEAIVRELRAKLSPSEKAAIERPMPNPEAFDLYLQAKELITTFHETPDWKKTLLQALRLLDEAISRDGTFALAYCWATTAHDNLYWFGLDHTPARLAQAKATAQSALALAPELGEAHLAQALVYYHGNHDYAHALEQVALAKRTLPNSAQTYSLAGWIARRQGRWDDASKNLEKAAELDPRNPKVLSDLSVLYDLLHDYDAKEALYDRAIAANPSTRDYFQLLRAETELEKGNLDGAGLLLETLPGGYDPDGAATSARMHLAFYQRQPAVARKALSDAKLDELIGGPGYPLPRSFYEGLIARASGDQAQARSSFTVARSAVETKFGDWRDNALAVAALGIIQAGAGEKEKAIALGQRAVELQPIANDAVDGPTVLTALAMIYAWSAEPNLAIEQLTTLSKIPGGPDYGQLRYDPAWDALRGEKHFDELVEAARHFHR
ncbi:MAG: tetratricopeptide repeat protein [Verrucomicrobiota bacterium]|nr:tetratricopeptide repeat protein [Verrucomicrobiota bacterium]